MEPMEGSVGLLSVGMSLVMSCMVVDKLGFLRNAGKASITIWCSFAVVILRDFNEMPFINPS